MNRDTLQTLARRWRQAIFQRDLCIALGVAVLALVPALLCPAAGALAWWVTAGFGSTLAILLSAHRPWRIDAARIARHLDRSYPEMEESGALFLKGSEQWTLLERLQARRVHAAITLLADGRRQPGTFGMPPRGFLNPAVFCATAALIVVAGAGWWRQQHPREGDRRSDLRKQEANQNAVAPPPAALAWPRIIGGGLLITPPAYTGHPPRRVEGFDAEVEEGAAVTWTLTLDRSVREARLVSGAGAAATLALEVLPAGAGAELTGTRTVTDPGLYSLRATLPDGTTWNPPALFALKVIKDGPPVLRIVQPAQARTEVAPPVPPAAPPRVTVEVEFADDYGVADARIIATVAKGSGEAVKFREQPIPFDGDAPDRTLPAPRAGRLTRTLDLGALGLEPGDELYFFVEAHDNRQPTANCTRSETRFITLRGPQEKAATTGKGVTGINLVPQYFRSERQLIIDTEKLLADRPAISDRDFRDRANGLGIDQQLLRLRYGQLLGEEMEGGNSDHAEVNLDPLQRGVPTPTAGPRAAASIAQRFLQEHEEQDREGGTGEQREAGARPEHPDRPLPAGEVVAPFVDQHDSQDKSTYYDGGVKGTMRDALAAMWDAEKYLRTARPGEALPPEHRALDILKDLQQSARAYVQHVGFDAPPIKIPQRRLTGDASDVPARGSVADTLPPGDPAVGAAREALAALPFVATASVDGETLAALRRVEPALTAAATRQPDAFLPGLQILRRLAADDGRVGTDPTEYPTLRRALGRLLPPARSLPDRAVEADPALARSYDEALSSAANPEGRP